MLPQLTRKQWIIIGASLVGVLAIVLAIIFWPPGAEEEEPPIAIEPVGPAFLEVDGAWADTMLAHMSTETKIGHLILARSRWSENQLDSLQSLLQILTPAGIILQPEKFTNHVSIMNMLDTVGPYFRPNFFVDAPLPTDVIAPAPEMAMLSMTNDSIRHKLDSLLITEQRMLGTNFKINNWLTTPYDSVTGFAPYNDINEPYLTRNTDVLDQFLQRNMMGCASAYLPHQQIDSATTLTNTFLDTNLQTLTNLGLPALVVPSAFSNYKRDTAMPLQVHFDMGWDFKGLIISEAETANPDLIVQLITDGADLILTDSAEYVFTTILSMLQGQLISKAELDYHVKRILLAKEWMGLLPADTLTADTKKYFKSKNHELLVRQSHEHSITFVNNTDEVLPIGDLRDLQVHLVRIGRDGLPDFMEYLVKYDSIKSTSYSTPRGFDVSYFKKSNPIIFGINDVVLDTVEHKSFFADLRSLDEQRNVIIVNFLHPENLRLLQEFESVVQVYSNDDIAQQLAAQAVFGGIPVSGRLPISMGELYVAGSGFNGAKTRLGFTIAEEFGISTDSLNKIDWLAQSAIWSGATPGCQVVLAKEGKVIYNKSFGRHIYDTLAPYVQRTDLYDLASVTKIAATTMTAMWLHSRQMLELDRGIGYLFPDTLKRYSRLQNITFRDLLLHQTGLSSAMPIYKYMSYRDELHGVFDMYWCDYDSTQYTIEVGENFYMDSAYQDSIWIDVHSSWPGTPDYKYSDLNMNLLYYYLSEVAQMRMDSFLVREYFEPLGLRNISYLPRQHYPLYRIVPTEDDNYWRFQLIHGYVHDPSAAMMGGVAGNAGLFSNALDLAVMMQVVLQKGSYGGVEFFSEETATEFMTRHVSHGSNRGLGFNMQGNTGVIANDAPENTVGHTGFTGNCAWVDPENEIVYVFLSNRVHPDQMNKKLQSYGVRGNIHQVIYDQLPKKKEPAEEPVQ